MTDYLEINTIIMNYGFLAALTIFFFIFGITGKKQNLEQNPEISRQSHSEPIFDLIGLIDRQTPTSIGVNSTLYTNQPSLLSRSDSRFSYTNQTRTAVNIGPFRQSACDSLNSFETALQKTTTVIKESNNKASEFKLPTYDEFIEKKNGKSILVI